MKKFLLKGIVILVVGLLSSALVISFSGCKETQGTTETAAEESTAPEGKFKIAYLCPDLENPAWKLVSDGVILGGADLGL